MFSRLPGAIIIITIIIINIVNSWISSDPIGLTADALNIMYNVCQTVFIRLST